VSHSTVAKTSLDQNFSRLEVKAVGKPKPEGKWLKQGIEIIPSREFLIENFEDGTSILTISEVYPDDTGDIVYEAQNPLGVAVTTTQLLVESTEGILGTKEYRKPEWVTHMEELQAALKASQSPPTFVQEITDVRTAETETVKFECLFSGTPTPDIIWYHNDKIVRNTDKVKVRIEDNKTSCTVTEVTKDHVGTYVCKATSDIGLAVTKAKLYVQEIPEEKKKQLLIQKAQEREEKVRKERVTIEKKRVERRRKKVVETHEEETKPLEVEEVTTVETAEQIQIEETKPEKATPKLDIQKPVATEAVASCKKIEETAELVEEEEKARALLSPTEPMVSEQIQPGETVKEMKDAKPKPRKARVDVEEAIAEFANITEVKLEEVISRVEKIIRKSEMKMAREVTEMLEYINAKDFGPGENPLREIAEIGYLLKNGISTKEVTVLYHENKFPSLTTPQAQSALVNVVERKGHGTLISEVLTEENIDEKQLAATVGFRALMKMVESNYVTIEEVITSFIPEDFIQRAWESSEITGSITKTSFKEMVTIKEEVEVMEGEFCVSCACPSAILVENNKLYVIACLYFMKLVVIASIKYSKSPLM
jgi:titin